MKSEAETLMQQLIFFSNFISKEQVSLFFRNFPFFSRGIDEYPLDIVVPNVWSYFITTEIFFFFLLDFDADRFFPKSENSLAGKKTLK